MKKLLFLFLALFIISSCDLFNGDDLSYIVRENPSDPGSINFTGVGVTQPEDGSDLSAIPVIEWIEKTDAAVYHLVLADNPELINPIIDDSTLTGNSYKLSILLENNKSYYWNMRYQRTDLQWSIWNRVQTFSLSVSYPKFKWEYSLGGSIITSPALGFDGAVYIGASDGKLYALNPEGTKKWEFSTGGAVYSSPSIAADGTIYFISNDKYLYAVNSDGTEKWKFYLGDFSYSADSNLSLAIGADGTIYTPGNLYVGDIIAINPDGSEKWNFGVTPQDGSLAINKTGNIIVCGWRDLLSIDATGTQQWVYTTTDGTSPFAFSSNNDTYFGKNGYLNGITENGTKLFKEIINTENASLNYASSSISSAGIVYSIAGIDEKLYACDLNGNLLWQYSPKERHDLKFAGNILGKDGTIFMPSIGEIIALNQNGTEKWIYKFTASVQSTPVLSDTGILYFGASDDSVYAIETGCPGLDDGPWPKNQKDNQNTGRY